MLVKACGPRQFWLTSFVLANVLIDVEVLYYLRLNDPPIHRYLHTYLGGTAMGLLAGLLMFGIVQAALRVVPTSWFRGEQSASTSKRQMLVRSLVAGLIGGVSHILLDSLMHHDMNPLWPIVDGNPLAGTIAVGTLHFCLALTGFFGFVLWLLIRES